MTTYTTCWKCQGKGHINGFSHVQGGICFRCDGAGQVKVNKPSKPSKKSQIKKQIKQANIAQMQAVKKAIQNHPAYIGWTPDISLPEDNPYYPGVKLEHFIAWKHKTGIYKNS